MAATRSAQGIQNWDAITYRFKLDQRVILHNLSCKSFTLRESNGSGR